MFRLQSKSSPYFNPGKRARKRIGAIQACFAPLFLKKSQSVRREGIVSNPHLKPEKQLEAFAHSEDFYYAPLKRLLDNSTGKFLQQKWEYRTFRVLPRNLKPIFNFQVSKVSWERGGRTKTVPRSKLESRECSFCSRSGVKRRRHVSRLTTKGRLAKCVSDIATL